MAYAKEAPLDDLVKALVSGEVPRHRRYTSVFISNLGRRTSFDVLRHAFSRGGVASMSILHMAWFEGTVLHLVIPEDEADGICAELEKLKFEVTAEDQLEPDAVQKHYESEADKSLRVSVKGYLTRRAREIAAAPDDATMVTQ